MPAVRCLFLTGLSLLVLLVGAPAWALDPARKVDEYTISRWTMEDGLSHNLVHAIQQDADGYAPEIGHSKGFPVGRDPKTNTTWVAHCYATVGVARDTDTDSGNDPRSICVGKFPVSRPL